MNSFNIPLFVCFQCIESFEFEDKRLGPNPTKRVIWIEGQAMGGKSGYNGTKWGIKGTHHPQYLNPNDIITVHHFKKS
jgi:hypothetical protein